MRLVCEGLVLTVAQRNSVGVANRLWYDGRVGEVDEVEAPFALDNRTRLEEFAAVEEGDGDGARNQG